MPSALPATATTQEDPLLAPVFAGTSTGGSYQGSVLVTGPITKTETIDSLLQEFEQMTRREQSRLALLLTLGGFAGSASLEDVGKAARDLTLNETLNAYLDLLNDAAGRYARGQKITPEQLLEQNVSYRLPRGANWDGSFSDLTGILTENDIDITGVGIEEEEKNKDLSGTFSSTSSSTNTTSNTSISRDVMDPNDAMALTRAMLQRELGRDPTKAEFEDFIGAIQYAQRTSPTKTTSTNKSTSENTSSQTTNKKGRVIDSDSTSDVDNFSSSTTQSGITQAGIDDILLRRARQNPDWAEWQAVGTYAPALFQALGATVPGV